MRTPRPQAMPIIIVPLEDDFFWGAGLGAPGATGGLDGSSAEGGCVGPGVGGGVGFFVTGAGVAGVAAPA
jgi:hypothetical protein